MMLCGFATLRDMLVLQRDTFSGCEVIAVFERFTRGNREAQEAERRAWTPSFGSKGRDRENGAGPNRESKLMSANPEERAGWS